MPTATQKLQWQKKKTTYAWAKFYELQWGMMQQQQHQLAVVQQQIDTTPTDHLKVAFLKMAQELEKKFTCSICMEEIPTLNTENKDSITITKCGHIFHKACLDAWFNQGKDTCPICRMKIKY